jgi:hypothetical protein
MSRYYSVSYERCEALLTESDYDSWRVPDADCVMQGSKSAQKPEAAAPSTTGDNGQLMDAKPDEDFCTDDWSDEETVDWLHDEEMTVGLSEENNNDSNGGFQQSRRAPAGHGCDQPLVKKSKLR